MVGWPASRIGAIGAEEYVFCKDNWLVLIVECLFAKASTANAELDLLKLRPHGSNSSPGATAHFHLKQHTQYQSVWTHNLKVANLKSYKKLSVWYFEVKLHIHTLGTSETYFTSCKMEHNSFLFNMRKLTIVTLIDCYAFSSDIGGLLFLCPSDGCC